MSKLIYSMGVSLDGSVADPNGSIDWTVPDEELHRFHNQQARELGAHFCGRSLYEVMLYWETVDENQAAVELEFAASGSHCRRSSSRTRSRRSKVTRNWPRAILPRK